MHVELVNVPDHGHFCTVRLASHCPTHAVLLILQANYVNVHVASPFQLSKMYNRPIWIHALPDHCTRAYELISMATLALSTQHALSMVDLVTLERWLLQDPCTLTVPKYIIDDCIYIVNKILHTSIPMIIYVLGVRCIYADGFSFRGFNVGIGFTIPTLV